MTDPSAQPPIPDALSPDQAAQLQKAEAAVAEISTFIRPGLFQMISSFGTALAAIVISVVFFAVFGLSPISYVTIGLVVIALVFGVRAAVRYAQSVG